MTVSDPLLPTCFCHRPLCDRRIDVVAFGAKSSTSVVRNTWLCALVGAADSDSGTPSPLSAAVTAATESRPIPRCASNAPLGLSSEYQSLVLSSTFHETL